MYPRESLVINQRRTQSTPFLESDKGLVHLYTNLDVEDKLGPTHRLKVLLTLFHKFDEPRHFNKAGHHDKR